MFNPNEMNKLTDRGTAYGGWVPALVIPLVILFLAFIIAGLMQ